MIIRRGFMTFKWKIVEDATLGIINIQHQYFKMGLDTGIDDKSTLKAQSSFRLFGRPVPGSNSKSTLEATCLHPNAEKMGYSEL